MQIIVIEHGQLRNNLVAANKQISPVCEARPPIFCNTFITDTLLYMYVHFSLRT